MDTAALRMYQSEIEAMRRELGGMPEGHLAKRGSCFYVIKGNAQRGITRDVRMIKLLARKAFLQRRLSNFEYNYSIEVRLGRPKRAEGSMEILNELSAFYQTLPLDHFFTLSARDWDENATGGYSGFAAGLVYTTESGHLVRSKSERIIADALHRNGIRFRYEEALILDGEWKCPDFSIDRLRDGALVLWEHFGLMDDDAYQQSVIDKAGLYMRHGFLPNDRLICSYERDIQKADRIQNIIEQYILG